MKTKKSIIFIFMVCAMGILLFNSCEKDDSDSTTSDTNSFNIWVQIGSYPNTSTFVGNVESVEEGTLDLEGKGVETTSKFDDYGLIVKDGYYYAVSSDGRFGKYQFTEDELVVEQEVPSLVFSLSYSLCPSWIDDNTLFIAASNGDYDGAVYATVDIDEMDITASGNIEGIEFPDDYPVLYTGTSTYMNDKIYLALHFVNESYEAYPYMVIAVVDPETLTVERLIEESKTGSWGNNYGGELYQHIGFKDEEGDYYFATRGIVDGQRNMVLRINSDGELDESYEGYNDSTIQIREMNYMGDGKAIVALYDPDLYDYSAGKLYPYSFGILDIYDGTLTNLDSPYSKTGTIKHIAVDKDNNKAYVLIGQEEGDSYIWTYDGDSGSFESGMMLPDGYDDFVRLDYMFEE